MVSWHLRRSVLIAGLAAAAAAIALYIALSREEEGPEASPETRRIEQLRRGKDVDALSREAASANAAVATRAVKALGKLGPAGAPRIREAFGDKREQVRQNALTAYADTRHVEDQRALDEMGQMARADTSPNVRAAAASALGNLAVFEQMEALLAAMDDDDEVVRQRAAAAAERIACVRVGYRAKDPPEKRREAIALLRAQWEQDKAGAAKYWAALRQQVKAGGS